MNLNKKPLALSLSLTLLLISSSLSQTGCAFARKHPTQTKIYVIGAGALIGGSIAIAHRRGTCTLTYPSGYVYVGTNPCPGYK